MFRKFNDFSHRQILNPAVGSLFAQGRSTNPRLLSGSALDVPVPENAQTARWTGNATRSAASPHFSALFSVANA